MKNNFDTFIKYQRKNLSMISFRSYPNGVLLWSSLGVPLVLLWLSIEALKWIRNAFIEDLKIMLRYTQLTNIGSLPHEAGLVAPRTYVHEAMNLGPKNE